MSENTLLGRCTVALSEALEGAIAEDFVTSRVLRAGIAGVLEHLAAELIVMNQRNERLSVHKVARILTLEAAGKLAGWSDDRDEEPDETWDSHPSLTAEDRNPTLR